MEKEYFIKYAKKSLSNLVDNKIYLRGLGYYSNGKVDDMGVEEDSKEFELIEIEAEVWGTEKMPYISKVYFNLIENTFEDPDCNCPYGSYCKHSIAVGLKFIEYYQEFLDNFLDIFDFPLDNVKGMLIGWMRKKSNNEELAVDPHDFEDRIMKNKKIALGKKLKIKNIKIKKNKFDADNCKIVIKMNDSVEIDILIKNIEEYPNNILREYEDTLTTAQKKLFSFLSFLGYHNYDFDYESFFILSQKAKIKIVKENTDIGDSMKIVVNPKNKLKVNIFKKNIDYPYRRRGDYFKEKKDIFVFKINKESEKHNILFGEKYIFVITDREIIFHKIPKILVSIIVRISSFSDYDLIHKEIELKIEEVLKINEIIESCQKYFELNNNIKPDFNIIKTKPKKIKPCVLVDYKQEEDLLIIEIAIDYEFYKKGLTQSMYYNYYGNRKEDYYFIKIEDKNIYYAEMDSEKEYTLKDFFHSNNLIFGLNKHAYKIYLSEKDIFKFLKKHWPNLKELAHKNDWEIININDKLELFQQDFKANFSVDLDQANDWLAFDVSCYHGKDKINLEQLQKYIKNKQDFIKTNDGKIVQITNHEELERFVMMLESFYAKENDRFEGRLYHAPELENIFTSSEYYDAKIAESFNTFIKEAKSGKPVQKIKIKQKFQKILRNYQKDGVDWLYFLRKYRFGGILADDMGLGKTLQSLYLLQENKVKNKPSIVVCPKTLLFNWQEEAKKFTPTIKTIIIDGMPKERKKMIQDLNKYDLVITSYPVLQKDYEEYKKQNIKFNYCIIDEAQAIKNFKTKNAKTVKQIDADYRLALTGTPLENSVAEIWSIFDYLMPGFLGSYQLFTKKFLKPIMKENSAMALEGLREKTACFMLRRTKDKVLKELPPKIEKVNHCFLEPAQNILYQEVLKNVKSEIFKTVEEKGFAKSQINILAGLTKLRQVCNHPVLLLKDEDYTKYESAKLNIFNELIREIISANRKVLVFSQFTMMLDILKKELEKDNIKYSYLSGQTKDRQAEIKAFNNDKNISVFLISLKAGGLGLNLTSADNVIIFDPWWNPSAEMQAIDRTHRIGQKKVVNVYRLITKGTIEDRIVALQEKKKFLFDNLVGESKDLFKKLTWDDIQGIFK